MALRSFLKGQPGLLSAAALSCVFLAAGRDDRVQVTRDPDVRVATLETWAWRPVAAPGNARDTRPVVSRDAISRGDSAVRDTEANNDMVRDRVKNAIAQGLNSKGLTQI